MATTDEKNEKLRENFAFFFSCSLLVCLRFDFVSQSLWRCIVLFYLFISSLIKSFSYLFFLVSVRDLFLPVVMLSLCL